MGGIGRGSPSASAAASAAIRSLVPLAALVTRRIRRRPLAGALVAGGVAAGTAMLVGVSVVAVASRDAALERTLDRLPARERVLRVSTSRSTAEPNEYGRELEPAARRALGALGHGGTPRRGVMFEGVRANNGTVVQIVALDDPGGDVAIRRGRPPRRCDGRRCEAVVVRGPAPRRGGLAVGALRLTQVAEGALSEVVLGRLDAEVTTGVAGSQEGRYEREAGGTRLVVNGVRPLGVALALSTVGRTYAWVAPVRSDDVHPWDADGLLRRIGQARAGLSVGDPDARLTAPDGAIRAEQARGRASERRLLLLGGQAAAALLAFAAYAASRRRRSVAEEWDRLRHAGARRWQLVSFVALEATLLAGMGAIAGWLSAVAGGATAAAARGREADAFLAESALAPGVLALAGAAWAVSALVIVACLRAPLGGGRAGARVLDAAALAALVALVWGARARGDVTAEDLAARGGDPILVALPGLLAFAAAMLAARSLPLVFRGLERAARRAGVAVRLALLSTAREPRRTAVAVTFLAISLALGVFALGYRAGLVRGQADQAAFRTAGDVRVLEAGPTLVSLPDVLPLDRYRRLAGARTTPILRTRARTLTATGADAVALVGVPAAELPGLPGWRSDFADAPLSELARRLAPLPGFALAGDPIPAGTRELRMRAHIEGSRVQLTLVIQRTDGRFERLGLGRHRGPASLDLHRRVPARAAGGRLVALSVSAPPSEEAGPLRGSTRLGALRIEGAARPVTRFDAGWEAASGATLHRRSAAGVRLSYSLSGSRRTTALRRRQAGAGPVPALLSRSVAREAGADGRLPLELPGGAGIELRLIGRARFFPGDPGERRFVVADAGRLFRAVNAEAPGSALPSEAWVRAPGGSATVVRALRAPPFRAPRILARADLERSLSRDPLAASIVWALLVASALGLALGAAGLALAVAMELADESGELRELEAMGMRPNALRRQVRLRAALIAAVALGFGLAGGLALTWLMTDLVAITANATAPVPPLITVIPWAQLGALIGAVGAIIAAGLWLQTRRAFASATAGRLHG